MKTGKTVTELAIEIQRQAKAKRDFVADTASLSFVADFEAPSIEGPQAPVPEVSLRLGNKARIPLNDIAHDQIAEHVKIPRPYYDRMRREAPHLLADNVDHWFHKNPVKRLVRTLDGRGRAFLSDKFPTDLDNIDFAEAFLPVLAKRKLNVMSCDITEKKLYLKAVDEQLYRDVPVGYKMGDGSHKLFDTCAPALILSNSEVGFGRLVVETGVYTGGCTNLALFAKGGMKRTHVGARHEITEGVDVEVLSEKTKRKTFEALLSQVADVIEAAFDEKVITRRLEAIEVAAGRKITAKVDDVLELTAKNYGLNDGEKESVLKHLIEGASLSQYGLHAAITRSAQDNASYDRATELEYLGGRILELPKTDWARLAEAA